MNTLYIQERVCSLKNRLVVVLLLIKCWQFWFEMTLDQFGNFCLIVLCGMTSVKYRNYQFGCLVLNNIVQIFVKSWAKDHDFYADLSEDCQKNLFCNLRPSTVKIRHTCMNICCRELILQSGVWWNFKIQLNVELRIMIWIRICLTLVPKIIF